MVNENEKPQNGLKGLKHWRHDFLSGLVVSLISLPFSLGIAIASGAPPITGLISAIIAGLIVPFLGGSYVTISGPAAGLAPVLLASMITLGHGNKEAGYPLLLACICIVGMIQIILAKLKLARLAQIFPTSVVEGMLAAIGLLIIVKQLPLLTGVTFKSKSFWGTLFEFPARLNEVNRHVMLISMICLLLVFGLASLGSKDVNAKAWRKAMPIVAPIITAVGGLGLATLTSLDETYRIHLPENPLHGFTFPHFSDLFADSSLWGKAAMVTIVLTLLDGVESLATIKAIDGKDPFGRRSDANETLFAMGVSNIASSLAGGLTIIPGGVKSSANITAGGRTQWANFYNAICLLVFVLVGGPIINLLPFSALAAIVVFMGWKLCAPPVWKHVAEVGKEQIGIFILTVLVTVTEDLLLGIFAGILAKLVVVLVKAKRTDAGHQFSTWAIFKSLFMNPVKEVDAGVPYIIDGSYEIVLNGPVVCFNSMHLQRALEKVPKDVKLVIIRCDPGSMLVMDHTSASNLASFKAYFEKTGRGEVRLEIEEGMEKQSPHACSLRVPLMTTVLPPS
jgi:carbonic anhydrase